MMSHPGFSFCIEIDREGDDETTLEVTGDVSAYDQGRCSGPPDSCYPPEGGEVAINTITVVQTGEKLTEGDLTEKEIRDIEDHAAFGELDCDEAGENNDEDEED